MTEFRYDPDVVDFVDLMPVTEQSFTSAEGIRSRRHMLDELLPKVPKPDGVAQEDRSIDGLGDAPPVRVRVYRPAEATEAPVPGVLEIHGGGFLMGSIEMMDGLCYELVTDVGAVVVSVDYRLAPEDPYPAGLDDCMAALRWMHDHADDLRIDPARICVAGQSAGGGLAAGLALRARDEGGPDICFQHLEIPELDHRLDTPSMLAFTDTPAWNRQVARWSWKHYLALDDVEPDPTADISPYASPSRAADVSGLPPAFVSVMEYDPLRDEGILYALALLRAGVQTELHAYPGTFHASGFATHTLTSRQAHADRIRAFDRELNRWVD